MGQISSNSSFVATYNKMPANKSSFNNYNYSNISNNMFKSDLDDNFRSTSSTLQCQNHQFQKRIFDYSNQDGFFLTKYNHRRY